METVIRSIRT
jgi:hypothetical protein